MRFVLITLFIISKGYCVFAQISTFNQYNFYFASINPAFIADVDKNQLSIIGRNQWPNNFMGAKSTFFSANVHIPKINSSIGVFSNYYIYDEKFYKAIKNGIQYGYRIIVYGDNFVCLGAGLNYDQSEYDINNYLSQFYPKQNYQLLNKKQIESNVLNFNSGILFQRMLSKEYIGISIHNRTVKIGAFNSNISEDPTLSVHGMKRFSVSRNSVLLNYANYERIGKILYDKGVLQNSYSYIFFQSNYLFKRMCILGVGYKYFSNNYGFINYRVGYVSKSKFIIGYSFDTLPYIKHDKIWFNSSHEIALKYNFSDH